MIGGPPVDPQDRRLDVNTAARVMSVAGPGEILVPASVREIVSGAGISFADHGTYRLKGLEDEARLFHVTAVEGEEVAPPLAADEADERRCQIFMGPNRGRGRVIAGAIAAAAIIAAISWFAPAVGTRRRKRPMSGHRPSSWNSTLKTAASGNGSTSFGPAGQEHIRFGPAGQ